MKSQFRRVSGTSTIPNVIFALLVINGLVFVLQRMTFLPQIGIDRLMLWFGLWPAGPENSPFGVWQLLTYGFLHGNLPHIFFNMVALWMFGRDLENMMGTRRFLTYYLTCVVGAGIVQLVVAQMQGGIYPTVGASGGVFGILLAYGMAFPNRTVMLIFPPIPMRAKYFVILFGLFELYLGFSGRQPGVANFAHLGGMLFGFLLIQYWKQQSRPR